MVKAFILFLFISPVALSTVAQQAEGKQQYYLNIVNDAGKEVAPVEIDGKEIWMGSIKHVIPNWYTSKKGFYPIDNDELKKWLKAYNRASGYDYVIFKKDEITGGCILCNEKTVKYLPMLLSSGQYKLCAETDIHLEVFRNRYAGKEQYEEFMRTPMFYVNGLYLGKEISPANPLKFAKALSPVLTNDAVINGKAVIAFYKDSTDIYPYSYYSGTMHNGVFDGTGLLIEKKDNGELYVKRGIFSNGQFMEAAKTGSVAKKILTRTFFNKQLGLSNVDSFTYTTTKQNNYPDYYNEYSYIYNLAFYSKGITNYATIDISTTQGVTEESTAFIKLDNTIKEFRDRKFTKGSKIDDYTLIRIGKGNRDIFGVGDGTFTEYPITVLLRKTIDGDWNEAGTWTIVEISSVNSPATYGLSLKNPGASYRTNNLGQLALEAFGNGTTVYFEKYYRSYEDAFDALIDYAKKR